MGTDTKNMAGVGGGYGGRQPGKSVTFATNILGGDGVGPTITRRVNEIASPQRMETTDRQKRREQGYRGL